MIPQSKPFITRKEYGYIFDSIKRGKLSGDGHYSTECSKLLEEKFDAKRILLTTSGTSSLELAALSLNIQKGDEIIMPSYTFVSTANAFVLRGAKPVFVDIRSDTLNIDETKIKEKITSRTKAIVPVHYAGVGCEMDEIMRIAKEHDIFVIEDAAQAVNASYKERFLGTIGDLGCYSFHDTKNYVCGEGGAIVINKEDLTERIEIIREKGTDRSKFLRGEVDKYTWVDVGSSYLPSEILAAFLYAQLEEMDEITQRRRKIYERYSEEFKDLVRRGIGVPNIPEECNSNYHMFYLLTKDQSERDNLIKHLRRNEICSVFHYVPLHNSPMGKKFGYSGGDLPVTEDLSRRIIRLPLFVDLNMGEQTRVIRRVKKFYGV